MRRSLSGCCLGAYGPSIVARYAAAAAPCASTLVSNSNSISSLLATVPPTSAQVDALGRRLTSWCTIRRSGAAQFRLHARRHSVPPHWLHSQIPTPSVRGEEAPGLRSSLPSGAERRSKNKSSPGLGGEASDLWKSPTSRPHLPWRSAAAFRPSMRAYRSLWIWSACLSGGSWLGCAIGVETMPPCLGADVPPPQWRPRGALSLKQRLRCV